MGFQMLFQVSTSGKRFSTGIAGSTGSSLMAFDMKLIIGLMLEGFRALGTLVFPVFIMCDTDMSL